MQIKSLMRFFPIVTIVLFLVLLLCFGLENLTGALDNSGIRASLFAVSRAAVADGRVERLATAAFFHVNAEHLLLNLTGLLFFLPFLEAAAGKSRTILIVIASAVGGQVGSIALQFVPDSVGASSILFGVFGATGVLLLLFRRELRRLFWIFTSIWIVDLGFLITVGILTMPTIDHGAHIGGFAAGVAAAAACFKRRESGFPLAKPGRSTAIVSLALCAMVAIAFVVEVYSMRALLPGL